MLACLLGLCAGLAQASGPPADRILHVELPTAETTLDPAAIEDGPTTQIASALFEGLVTYDYLARPTRIVPLLATALPEVSTDGRTLRFHLRSDVRFADDPAFHGTPRFLKASDVAFTLMRLVDPVLHSPSTYLLDGRIEGLDALAKAAVAAHRGIDYGARIPGLQVLDAHTLQIRLTRPDPLFLHALAQPALGILAPEVVQHYAESIGEHPVGTGPYVLQRWVHGSELVLDANPVYRVRHWDFVPDADPGRQHIAAVMQGKRIPAIPEIDIKVIEESQTAWLTFQQGGLDILLANSKLAPVLLRDGRLRPQIAARGYQLARSIRPEIMYHYLNVRDPVVGGMDAPHLALRRAILMALDGTEFIRVIRHGEAIPLDYLIPPGITGHDPDYRPLLRFDPAAANRLLDAFGYRPGPDGWRTTPAGKPLIIPYWRTTEGDTRDFEELFRRDLARIHLKVAGRAAPFGELLKAERDCQVTGRLNSWTADYPDGDDFLQLFYGPNIQANNSTCFQDRDWDALYEQSQRLSPGPERDRIYHRLVRTLELDGVIRMSHARVANVVLQPRVQGYQRSLMESLAEWPYLDLQ